jgi:pilus assembly protein CpaC
MILLAATPPRAETPPPEALPVVQSPPNLRIERMTLEAGTGRVLLLSAPAASLFAAAPRIAEMRPASPTSVFVFGVAPGRTTLAAMDAAGAPLVQWEVTVRPSAFLLSDLQSALRRSFPGNRSLRVQAGHGGIVLSGSMSAPADAERAQALIRSRRENERVPIDNRIAVTGVTQVNLRVRVAEVSREVTRQLGVNWQALGTIGQIGTAVDGPAGLAFETFSLTFDRTNPSDRLGVGFRTGNAALRDINAIIDALAQDRLVSSLAEPNLTATSGETASFLAGGEFPIPVSQRENQVTIEFKQFGVGLAFVPTVLSGRAHLLPHPLRGQRTVRPGRGAAARGQQQRHHRAGPDGAAGGDDGRARLGAGLRDRGAAAGLLPPGRARAALRGGGADPRRAVPLRPLPAQ